MTKCKNSSGLKTTFCKSLDWKIPIHWFDLTGIFEFPGDEVRRAVITLRPTTTHDHFDGFEVQIVNKHEGMVALKCFSFNDYLSERSDARDDYRDGFGVIAYCGWEWYIAIPKTTRPFCEAVEAYIALWM